MWIGIVLAVLNLLSSLPELIEKIKEIFEMFKKVPRMKVIHEAKKLAAACNERVRMPVSETGGVCPVGALLEELKARYP